MHPRGRGTFANLGSVETPDPYTATLVLTKAAPYLIAALDASESPSVPKPIYEGADPLAKTNGAGPFVFKRWDKGSDVILDRNPNYCDKGKPYLDRVIVRFIPDARRARRSGSRRQTSLASAQRG